MRFGYMFANLTFLVKEPGQARHASIGSFPTGSAFNPGRNLEIGSGSHKSSLFPWDNAGLSSSVAGLPFEMGSDRFSLGQDDVRLKNASVGRSSGREGSLVASQLNSGPGTLGFSPKTLEKIGSHMNDSFEFDGRGPKVQTCDLLIWNLQFQGGVSWMETLLGWNPIP
jgi:meiotic recombination protein REC8, fungi type